MCECECVHVSVCVHMCVHTNVQPSLCICVLCIHLSAENSQRNYSYNKHVQAFFLSVFPKQYSATMIYIAFTVC